MNTLLPLFNMVLSVAMLLVFLRFMMQFAGFDRSNPYIEPIYKTTQIVDMFGRIFPTVSGGRVSLAAVMLLFLLKLIDLSGNAALTGQGYTPIELFFRGALGLVLDFLKVARYLIFGSIILSWVVVLTQKMHPIIGIIMQLAEPILAPFRRITPNLGMIDLSPMFAIFGIILIEMVVVTIGNNLLQMVG